MMGMVHAFLRSWMEWEAARDNHTGRRLHRIEHRLLERLRIDVRRERLAIDENVDPLFGVLPDDLDPRGLAERRNGVAECQDERCCHPERSEGSALGARPSSRSGARSVTHKQMLRRLAPREDIMRVRHCESRDRLWFATRDVLTSEHASHVGKRLLHSRQWILRLDLVLEVHAALIIHPLELAKELGDRQCTFANDALAVFRRLIAKIFRVNVEEPWPGVRGSLYDIGTGARRMSDVHAKAEAGVQIAHMPQDV